jgi:hypothetical protein
MKISDGLSSHASVAAVELQDSEPQADHQARGDGNYYIST